MKGCMLLTAFFISGYALGTEMTSPPPTPPAPQAVQSAPVRQNCPQYIQSGEWVYRAAEYDLPEWTLSLEPTPCGRYIDQTETAFMFYEIAKKFSGSPYWTNTRGMINQLTCHLVIAREKDKWNLEPFRPYVGYAATVAAGCNPLEPKADPEFQ